MKIDLCFPCAKALESVYDLKKVREPVDTKISCAECGRRRYGATYEAVKKNRRGGGGCE